MKVLVFLLSLVAMPAWAQNPKPMNLALGSVTGSSSIYAFSVAIANTVRKYDPGLNVTRPPKRSW